MPRRDNDHWRLSTRAQSFPPYLAAPKTCRQSEEKKKRGSQVSRGEKMHPGVGRTGFRALAGLEARQVFWI